MPNFDDVDLAIFAIAFIGLSMIIAIAIWPQSYTQILAGVGAITGPIAGLARGKTVSNLQQTQPKEIEDEKEPA